MTKRSKNPKDDDTEDELVNNNELEESTNKEKESTNKENDSIKSKLVFRNYRPYDKVLHKYIRKNNNEDSYEFEIDGLEFLKKEFEAIDTKEINIIPKKPNHDLKSQISNKMDKLKRKTQRVIVELLREKISNNIDED